MEVVLQKGYIMKIILEESNHILPDGKRRIEIECGYDDINILDFKEKLLVPALLAWTYHQESINELFNHEGAEE
jgi:hypothetical protein